MTDLGAYIRPLLAADQDFSSAFMLVNRLPEVVTGAGDGGLETVFRACERVLSAEAYRAQKQAYFLYRAVAHTLQRLATHNRWEGAAECRRRSLALMLDRLDADHDGLERAMAEGVGTLPLAADRRREARVAVPPPHLGAVPLCDGSWLAARGVRPLHGWSWRGRSMLTATRTGDVLVVKCLRRGENPEVLCREAAWMTHLRRDSHSLEVRFDVPQPLGHDRGWLVRAPLGPEQPADGAPLHPRRYALAFLASPDYFHYPNEADPGRRLTADRFREVLARNAWLMGWLMGRGIAHTAPIPLFHNRAQAHRREDGGRYRWAHAGRLDRWLGSCRHPNFGVSGLRDFEHFEILAGRPGRRYEAIGSHLISLLLVAGSYFRQKAPGRMGWDASGQPVDARDLFDRDLLEGLVRSIYRAYFEGFNGRALPDGAWSGPEVLAERMIEEMGVDRHMEEILRVADQQGMDRGTFVAFLQSRGIPAEDATRMPRGREDILLLTGPHLGGFNQSISLPELTAFAGTGAARCVAARFFHETDAPPHGNATRF